jgi:hypothetical protein
MTGSGKHRSGESIEVDKSKVLDHSTEGENNISTSVDCYVSGHYTDSEGRQLTVKQRYTVYVKYSKSTLTTAMSDVRNQIIRDFQAKYPGLMVDDTFVPAMIAPLGREGILADEGFYYGSKMFRELTKKERLKYNLGTATEMYRKNYKTIEQKYSGYTTRHGYKIPKRYTMYKDYGDEEN